jgi:hypothetical protein
MWLVAADLPVVALEVLLVAFPSLDSPPHEMTVRVAPSPTAGQWS